ncbi:odorant receptor 67d [Drosophila takahashii]|uniref:odorant receptor 67d n=1 Tax=Drosophila takahashii TaxID=29030 RepID=UPI001CF8A1EC|nr:odorant receptor 67d [Drosophila takahashii]
METPVRQEGKTEKAEQQMAAIKQQRTEPMKYEQEAQEKHTTIVSKKLAVKMAKVEPVERYRKVIRMIRFCVGFCGNDVADPNFRMWWLTYTVIGAIGFFFACTGYTIYVGVVINGDLTVILQAFAMVGSAIQGLTKLLVTANMAPQMREIQNTFDEIYQEYGAKGGEYAKCLEQRIRTTWQLIIGFMLVYIILLGLIISFPIYYLVILHQKVLVMQFLMPLLDHTTDGGHLLLTAVHIALITFGGFGNYGGDMYLFLFVTHVPLIKDIFCVKLKEFNEVVVNGNEFPKMRSMLCDLLTWHQLYSSILQTTKKIYSIVLFVQLSTTCVGLLCTISCIFIKAWPAAPLYLLFAAITLYTFCGLGTLVENANEDFLSVIYTNCLWYELPVKEEKLIILMLAKAQKEVCLTAADMAPLSMNTALQLTKGIYSFSMMLMNYLGKDK